MTLLIASFLAGVLTIAAPCILPLLPVIIGGSLVRGGRELWRPVVIAASLAVSVVLFTLLLKATTALLGVPVMVWQGISAIIVVLLGLTLVFPVLWERLMVATNLQAKANQLLGVRNGHKGVAGDIMFGAALGPVFNSCSPTYALIIAAVLPVSFGEGLAYLVAYAVGLSTALLLVAFLGRAVTVKLGWLSNPNGYFTKVVGILLIVVGIAILFGLDKMFQTFVLEQGWYAPIERLEHSLMLKR